jgi:hypothetical protein
MASARPFVPNIHEAPETIIIVKAGSQIRDNVFNIKSTEKLTPPTNPPPGVILYKGINAANIKNKDNDNIASGTGYKARSTLTNNLLMNLFSNMLKIVPKNTPTTQEISVAAPKRRTV